MSDDMNFFDFDALTKAVGENPFTETSSYSQDKRFYVLSKNDNGDGSALLCFLPDAERRMVQKMVKINTTIIKDGKKRFVSEYSPATIGMPCPFHERWQELYNSGKTEEARTYARSIRYVANVKILKDPVNPDNDGKIFLFEMSQKVFDKIKQALNPSEQDIALGAEKKEIFNPFRGWVFKLSAKKGANGIVNYDSSEFTHYSKPIYDNMEDALEDIKNNSYKLSDLIKPENFKSYDELVSKLKWVTFENNLSSENLNNIAVAEIKTKEPEVVDATSKHAEMFDKQSLDNDNDLNAILDELTK